MWNFFENFELWIGQTKLPGNIGGHQFTSRIELLPFGAFTSKGDYSGADLKRESIPKLMLAATYDSNQNAVKNRGNQGSYMETNEGFFQTALQAMPLPKT